MIMVYCIFAAGLRIIQDIRMHDLPTRHNDYTITDKPYEKLQDYHDETDNCAAISADDENDILEAYCQDNGVMMLMYQYKNDDCGV